MGRVPRTIIQQSAKQSHAKTQLLSYGVGALGALGFRDFKSRNNFELHDQLLRNGIFPKQVSAGWGHTSMVTHNGDLFTWGRTHDINGILETFRIAKHHPELASSFQSFVSKIGVGLQPQDMVPQLQNANGVRCIQVAASAGITMALTAKGEIISFGNNRYGQLGRGTVKASGPWDMFKTWTDPQPSQTGWSTVTGLKHVKIIKVATGMAHVLALSECGQVFSWGRSERGQLGHIGTAKDVLAPKVIDSFFGHKVVDISCGLAHSVAVLEDGRMFVWGKFQSLVPMKSPMKLRFEVYSDQKLPRHVQVDGHVTGVTCSFHQTAIQTADGKIRMTGIMNQEDAQMNKEEWVNDPTKRGLGACIHEPRLIEGSVLERGKIVKLVGGLHDTFALMDDGRVASFALGSGEAELYDKLKGKVVLDLSQGWFHQHAVVKCDETDSISNAEEHVMASSG